MKIQVLQNEVQGIPFKTWSIIVHWKTIVESQDEWSGEQKLQYTDIAEDIEPEEIRPMGNYAVSITWPDGFSQVLHLTSFHWSIVDI